MKKAILLLVPFVIVGAADTFSDINSDSGGEVTREGNVFHIRCSGLQMDWTTDNLPLTDYIVYNRYNANTGDGIGFIAQKDPVGSNATEIEVSRIKNGVPESTKCVPKTLIP